MGTLRYNIDLIGANLLFGANFSFYASLTTRYLDFRQIFMLQLLAATCCFAPFALFSPRAYRLAWSDLGNILLVALLVVYGWMFLLLRGASYTTPLDAATISTLGPAFTLITAHLLHRQRLSGLRVAGVACALAGAAVLIFDKGFVLVHGSEAYGNALVLCAVVAIAINTVIIKPQLLRFGTLPIMGWYYLVGFLLAAPLFWHWLPDRSLLRLPPVALAELLYVLIPGTVIPMYLLYRGTEKLTPVHTALYRYIQPFGTALLGFMRGQTLFDAANLVAGLLIFVGALIFIRSLGRTGPPGTPPDTPNPPAPSGRSQVPSGAPARSSGTLRRSLARAYSASIR